ncbi:TetR/AcrR family transcriptional regulator [Paenibacillus doosanensis]|uniref:HTH-type transcriptional regulator AcrR n=1 Tax=Paenibacillus konkukensis TaxID=2020716 RepID=A0ABY4RG96_9BACL|nr:MULTISPECIES: TetR/AcrR family transcriptional regulator [Paenibacillus]MCS7460493.1 TetR/AcrR family transcriptional regulator [Paenibacillus doosanensis]UQZ81288.1 HTH-type transcriptional regulator AcrR [Paenibacillus konkukensis]
MPRNKEQNEEIRKQRKEAIIRGALKVYAEKGYAAAEIGEVAEQAGVARGLVYYYFKDKHSLFKELFMFMFDQSRKHVQSHFSGEGQILRMLEDFVRSMYNNMLGQTDSVLFFMRMRHDLRELFTPEELKNWSWHLDNMTVIRGMVKKGMEQGELRRMSPPLLATQYWGAMMHGMVYLRQSFLELQEKGMDPGQIRQEVRQDLEDAVACCMALLAPAAADCHPPKGEENV